MAALGGGGGGNFDFLKDIGDNNDENNGNGEDGNTNGDDRQESSPQEYNSDE